MRVRRAALAVSIAASLVPVFPASAAEEFPRDKCTRRVNDDPGDVDIDYGLSAAPAQPPTVSDSDVDIRSVTLRVTKTHLEAFLRVAAIRRMGSTKSGISDEVKPDRGWVPPEVRDAVYPVMDAVPVVDMRPVKSPIPDPRTAYAASGFGNRYVITFRRGTTNFRLEHYLALSPAAALEGAYPKARTTNDFTGVTGSIDAEYVTIRVPRNQVEQRVGSLRAGTRFDKIFAATYREELSYPQTASAAAAAHQSWLADDTTPVVIPPEPGDPGAGAGTVDVAYYDVGDDFCFGLPPALIEEVDVLPAQYGDETSISGFVVDEEGEPIPGKPVSLTVSGDTVGARRTSDRDGFVEFLYPAVVVAGEHAVLLSFAGDTTNGATTARAVLVVRPEVVVVGSLQVSKSGSSRVVTATVGDDDGTPVAGHRVDWYVQGKRVATTTTDRNGRTVFRGARAGQSVQARFPSVAGKYLSAASRTVRV